MSFVHLHVHSHYSLLDGLTKIPELVKAAKDQAMSALALTDHGAMYGVIEFYKECLKQGIKPIIGMEAYMAPRQLHLKQKKTDSKNFHLTLLAKNQQGYKNLMQLSTIGQVDGFYYRPRIDKKVLAKYSDGLICLSGCLGGELRQVINSGNLDKVRQIAREFKSIFKDDYYLEMQNLMTKDNDFKNRQAAELKTLNELSQELDIPTVATCDVHYLESQDAEIQDILVCIQTGKEVTEEKRLDMRGSDLSLYSAEKMQELFKEYPEAIANTLQIAAKCDLKLDLKTWHYPKFNTPKGKTDEVYIKELVLKGAKKKYATITEKVQARIDYELDIINYKKYSSYFLIYADFMSWAKKRRILTTARGSASGSIVSYCLGITNIDPLKYTLPFERFLTKERPSPPDIDADISDNHRDEVIAYVRDKYGADKVAQICTFGTMMARGSFRDVARVLGHEATWADKYAKMIPFGSQGFPMTLAKALEVNSELKQIYNSDPQVKYVYDRAQKIEGCARHVSVHAAGVVATPTTLTDFLPLQVEPKGRNIITQYDMYAIDPNASKESVGLLKMDFLGLRNLSILGICVDLVKKIKNQDIDVYSLPLEDKKTFAMLSAGLTFGVFQFASSGMTKHLRDLKPAQISDLMAMVALYRPGPIENIPEFIRRKNNPSLITYPDPRLKEVLEMSYGLLVYQDDVLYTVIILAGYEPAEADAFRKAVGKKIPSEMAAQRAKFFTGCQKNGLTQDKTEEIWKLIEPFAAYGFNKAHAASYGMLAYQTAYMKANFPAEYMTALMTCEAANMDKIAEAVRECKLLGIKVLPPDVNESRGDFTYISDSAIRFGLNAIKNLGSDIIQAAIQERKKNGNYVSLEDFLKRVKSKNLNKKSIEALAKAGALDSLGERGQMVYNIDKILQFLRYTQNGNTQQASLFGDEDSVQVSLKLDPVTTVDLKEKLSWEKDLLGLYVSDHPFSQIIQDLPDNINRLSELNTHPHDKPFITAGLINKTKEILTKKGDQMMFVEIEDLTSQVEVVVFPSIFKKTSDIWLENKPVLIKGKVNERDSEHKLIADQVIELTKEILEEPAYLDKFFGSNKPLQPARPKIINVKIPTLSDSEKIQSLKALFQNPGEYNVNLELGQNGGTKSIATKYKIQISEPIKASIEAITGKDSVRII